MKVHFDITHPAHINLFKHAIQKLHEDSVSVQITALNRGKLPVILFRELSGTPISIVGERPNTKFGVIWDSNLKRLLELFKVFKRESPDIVVSSGSISATIAARLNGVPSLLILDDPERVLATYFQLIGATKAYYPKMDMDIKYFRKKVSKFNALKQWAYLSPDLFKPNEESLKRYGLTAKEYIFIREVSTSSLNYSNQDPSLIAYYASVFPQNTKVVLSLEDKNARHLYPKSWIILEEPVEDIHSLIYFSQCMVSSGDSMAREAAMMGVPSLYVGIRKMSANQVLIDKNLLKHIKPGELPDQLDSICLKRPDPKEQKSRIKELDTDWINLSDFIYNKIYEHARK